MAGDDVVKKLAKLAQLDIDAVRAYEQALEEITVPSVHASLMSFKRDHEQHIVDLSREIKALGGEPPENSPDLKGFLITGFTAIRSLTGTEGALKAMLTNEKLTTSTYESALKEDSLLPHVRELVEKNYSDERRHLAYIEKTLADKPWL